MAPQFKSVWNDAGVQSIAACKYIVKHCIWLSEQRCYMYKEVLNLEIYACYIKYLCHSSYHMYISSIKDTDDLQHY